MFPSKSNRPKHTSRPSYQLNRLSTDSQGPDDMRRGLVSAPDGEHRDAGEEEHDRQPTNGEQYGYYDPHGQTTMPDPAAYVKPSQQAPSVPYHYADALGSNGHHAHAGPKDPYAPDTTAGQAGETFAQHAAAGDEPELGELGVAPALLDWDAMKKKGFWLNKKAFLWYIIIIVLVVLVALMAIFHSQIVNWLKPAANWLKSKSWGWIIAVVIIIVLSTPPLFGNEVVLVVVGLVWGLGEGFGIALMGTLLGEVFNFYLFRYFFRGYAEREKHKSFIYACLAHVLEYGGFLMCWVSRLSVLPTHFTTVVFAVTSFPFWKYFLAVIASSPKQLINVYVGVILAKNESGVSSTNSKVISDSVFGVTAVISIAVLWWIWKRMEKVREEVWAEHQAWIAEHGKDGKKGKKLNDEAV